MDTMSAAEVARRLGTTIPRVKRALDRLDLRVEESAGGRVRIDPTTFERLREALGVGAPLEEMTRTETAVLAALDRAPFGLVSSRAVAWRAGVSPTAASGAVARLVERGLVERAPARVAAGRAREVELLRPVRSSAAWRRLAPELAGVRPPERPAARAAVVPPRLRHLFWNVAPAQLDVATSGGTIARRLLETSDPEGLAWGAEQLAAADWRHAARARGLDSRTRRLAHNLAAAADGRSRASEPTELDHVERDARGQRRLAPTIAIGGIPVAGIEDILAMKLKVIGDRGELRDYFDVMTIEQRLGRTVEEGIALYLDRFQVPPEHESVRHIVLGLGYLDDVDDDELLPVDRAAIDAYWRRRQPQVVRNLSRFR